MDETVPLQLQGDGYIDGYSEIKDGQLTKFEVTVSDSSSAADVAREIPDDWQIETDSNADANIWPPQATIHTT